MASPKTSSAKQPLAEEPDPFKGEAPPPPAADTSPGPLEAQEAPPAPKAPTGRKLLPAAPPAAVEPARATYRVWDYGALQRNGKTYQPGETLALTPEEAAKIPCLVRV